MQNLISTYFEHDLVSLPEIKATQTEQGRFYLGSGGQKYASVTTVLGRRKEKRKSLAEWRQRVGNETANKIVENRKLQNKIINNKNVKTT